nr:MAG: RNA-dependent RNA polymerase [Tuatara cloaca-associated totivirus-2]
MGQYSLGRLRGSAREAVASLATFHDREAAWVRCVYFSAVASVDDYRQCGFYTLGGALAPSGPAEYLNVVASRCSSLFPDPVSPSHQPSAPSLLTTSPPPISCKTASNDIPTINLVYSSSCPLPAELSDWDYCNSVYSENTMGAGSTAVLGIPDVMEVLPAEKLQYFLLVADVNRGGRQWAVTAVGLAFTAFPLPLIIFLFSIGWLSTPLIEWPQLCKRGLNSIRRTGSVHPCFGLSPTDLLLLRKLASCAARERIEADWEAEFQRRVVNTPAHYYPMPDGTASRTEWVKRLRTKCRHLCRTSVDMITTTARLEDWGQWWQSRAKWAPKGSSNSHSAVEDTLRRKGAPLGSDVRAGKKSLMTTIGDRSAIDFLHATPATYPRKSTKHEPGLKNRALYAQDDHSFIVSAFPSVAVEKYINFDGIYAQQAPTDVANWVRNHIIGKHRRHFALSIDYSDFNSDHELSALSVLDQEWAAAWYKLGGGQPASRTKAACSVWAALAHGNSWVPDAAGTTTRIFGGLFSGGRNTARDNSMLHAAYSQIMHDAAVGMCGHFELLCPAYTGDDEDAQFKHWYHALFYLLAHYAANFALTSHKQLAGMTSHEYLQRALSDDNEPRRPLCAALAQLCSGNWYQTNYVWFDGIIQSVNDNCWELHTRGIPLLTARVLAKRVLNRAMVIHTPGGKRKLEWWRFRTNGAFHPLWGVATEVAPAVELGTSAISTVPDAHGVDAWVAKAKLRFGSALTESKLKMYGRDLQRDCYAELYVKERNRSMHHDAAKSWPERKVVDPVVDGGVVYLRSAAIDKNIEMLLLGGVVERHPRTTTELISRFGIDPQLYAMLGGARGLLAHLTPGEVSQWESIVELGPVPPGWHSLDPALRSWATNFRHISYAAKSSTGHRVRLLRASPNGAGTQPVHVVYAANGSGKTTFSRHNYEARVLDFDELVRFTDTMDVIKIASQSCQPHHTFSHLVHRLAEGLKTFEFSILTTQYPWSLVSSVLQVASIPVANVHVMRPDWKLLAERLAAERFWLPDKLERRRERFVTAVNQLPPDTLWHASWDDILSSTTVTIPVTQSHSPLLPDPVPLVLAAC